MKKIFNYIGKAVTIFAIAYIVYYIYNIDFKPQLVQDWTSFIVLCFIGTIVLTGCVFGMGQIWKGILKKLTPKHIDSVAALKVYVKANIGKYLPGNVMHYVERNLFAVNAGMGQAEIAVSSVMEVVIEILTAGIIACVFLFDDVIRILSNYVSPIIICGLVVLMGMGVAIIILFCKKNEKARELLHRLCSKDILFLSLKNMISYSVIFLLMGTILVAIFKFPLECDVSVQMFGYVIASYILAWVIGFVVPGAPGGIGVREFVLITLLGANFSQEYIVFAMITHRILTVFGDVLAYFLSISLLGRNKQSNSK